MKKILTFILSFVFAFAAVPLFACAKENPETTLYIDISNAGYGIDWLNPLKDIFEEENEGFTVKIRLCVGNGIGPLTIAPVAFTALTIFSADLSTNLWS